MVSSVTQPVSSVTAVLPKDTVYTVNDSDVKVVDGRPSLLVDEIVSTDNSASGSDYRGVLVDKAVKLVGEGFQNVATQAKYLDLVDAANGNTWIQTDSNVTIYWPYPQGTDANTKFRLVHFDGLDREMTADEVMDAINKNEPVVVKDLVTDQYGIRFETDSFSPFVLVWDNTQTTTVTEEDDHPDIAEAIANGTWGQPTPQPEAKPAAKKDISLALYDAGLNAFQARKYDEAQRSFADFMKNYPTHSMAPDAQYYLAECYFQRNQFPDAALAYDTVITKFSKSNRTPGAYLKQGICFSKMNQKAAAKARMNELIKKYPNSPEAARAKNFLKTNK